MKRLDHITESDLEWLKNEKPDEQRMLSGSLISIPREALIGAELTHDELIHFMRSCEENLYKGTSLDERDRAEIQGIITHREVRCETDQPRKGNPE